MFVFIGVDDIVRNNFKHIKVCCRQPSFVGMMMMIAVIIVVFGPQFVSSSTSHTGKLSQDQEDYQDQDQRLLQSVMLPSIISNQLTTLLHAPLKLLSSQVNNANTIGALSSSIPDYEMQALKDLYYSTNGDNWNYRYGNGNGVQWDFTDGNINPCSWYGLKCSYDSSNDLFHLTKIALNSNGLVGTLPDSLGQLSELTSLDLRNNQLIGSIPASLGQLSELIHLDLWSNSLTGTIPHSLGNLSELTWFSLFFNQLIGSIPASLGQLSKLTALGLSGNSLTGTLPDYLGKLLKLTYLSLSYNSLTGTLPDSLGNLSELTSLSLNNNQLIGSIPASLGQLSKLTALGLSGNSLTGTLPDYLGKLLKLTYLSLSYNSLTGTLPDSLGQLSELIYTTFDNNQLIGSIPASLGQLSELTYLYLNDNQLNGTIPSSLTLCKCHEMYVTLYDNNFDCYPTCMTSSRNRVQVDEDIPVCDGPSYNDICESKSMKSMMIVWIILPIAFVLLVAVSVYLYYRYRNHYTSVESSDISSQYVDINQNNTIIDDGSNDHNHDVNSDLSTTEGVPEIVNRIKDISALVGEKDASSESRHERRDNVSQVQLEPVVRGELVSSVAGTVATDNEILNLPTAVANTDDRDVLYVDLFSHV